MTKFKYRRIYKNTFGNAERVKSAKKCGCVYCLKIYNPAEVDMWTDDEFCEGTAICPHCLIDSVLPESDEYALTPELLRELHEIAFGKCWEEEDE